MSAWWYHVGCHGYDPSILMWNPLREFKSTFILNIAKHRMIITVTPHVVHPGCIWISLGFTDHQVVGFTIINTNRNNFFYIKLKTINTKWQISNSMLVMFQNCYSRLLPTYNIYSLFERLLYEFNLPFHLDGKDLFCLS